MLGFARDKSRRNQEEFNETIGAIIELLAVLSVHVTFAIGNSSATAADVLSNGGLEMGAGPANWTLTQSIVGDPGAVVGATEQLDFANQEFLALRVSGSYPETI